MLENIFRKNKNENYVVEKIRDNLFTIIKDDGQRMYLRLDSNKSIISFWINNDINFKFEDYDGFLNTSDVQFLADIRIDYKKNKFTCRHILNTFDRIPFSDILERMERVLDEKRNLTVYNETYEELDAVAEQSQHDDDLKIPPKILPPQFLTLRYDHVSIDVWYDPGENTKGNLINFEIKDYASLRLDDCVGYSEKKDEIVEFLLDLVYDSSKKQIMRNGEAVDVRKVYECMYSLLEEEHEFNQGIDDSIDRLLHDDDNSYVSDFEEIEEEEEQKSESSDVKQNISNAKSMENYNKRGYELEKFGEIEQVEERLFVVYGLYGKIYLKLDESGYIESFKTTVDSDFVTLNDAFMPQFEKELLKGTAYVDILKKFVLVRNQYDMDGLDFDGSFNYYRRISKYAPRDMNLGKEIFIDENNKAKNKVIFSLDEDGHILEFGIKDFGLINLNDNNGELLQNETIGLLQGIHSRYTSKGEIEYIKDDGEIITLDEIFQCMYSLLGVRNNSKGNDTVKNNENEQRFEKNSYLSHQFDNNTLNRLDRAGFLGDMFYNVNNRNVSSGSLGNKFSEEEKMQNNHEAGQNVSNVISAENPSHGVSASSSNESSSNNAVGTSSEEENLESNEEVIIESKESIFKKIMSKGAQGVQKVKGFNILNNIHGKFITVKNDFSKLIGTSEERAYKSFEKNMDAKLYKQYLKNEKNAGNILKIKSSFSKTTHYVKRLIKKGTYKKHDVNVMFEHYKNDKEVADILDKTKVNVRDEHFSYDAWAMEYCDMVDSLDAEKRERLRKNYEYCKRIVITEFTIAGAVIMAITGVGFNHKGKGAEKNVPKVQVEFVDDSIVLESEIEKESIGEDAQIDNALTDESYLKDVDVVDNIGEKTNENNALADVVGTLEGNDLSDGQVEDFVQDEATLVVAESIPEESYVGDREVAQFMDANALEEFSIEDISFNDFSQEDLAKIIENDDALELESNNILESTGDNDDSVSMNAVNNVSEEKEEEFVDYTDISNSAFFDDYITIGSWVSINENSPIYSNKYNAAYSENGKTAYYAADAFDRIVGAVVVSNNNGDVQVLYNQDEVNNYVLNGYVITSYCVLNEYSQNNNSFEGFYSASDVTLAQEQNQVLSLRQ